MSGVGALLALITDAPAWLTLLTVLTAFSTAVLEWRLRWVQQRGRDRIADRGVMSCRTSEDAVNLLNAYDGRVDLDDR
ncbi:hypothetical protein [Actinocorallia sp. A-T 12471]|uniref:hypothetical protein n=1 Tax=Actinocorallia sp. A-T 12471 TaxID=3089813 RepID=UPI0029CC0888|nr:hypothetical protein [Actinocorallia sp. A-T 12471]MDX6743911.1 hypothetical protein [Actinocorallia sp. A-T 12471]